MLDDGRSATCRKQMTIRRPACAPVASTAPVIIAAPWSARSFRSPYISRPGGCGSYLRRRGWTASHCGGANMLHSPILAPVMALVLWSFVMWAWLYATRIPAITRLNIVFDPLRPNSDFNAQIPPKVRWKADNYNNLMEQPTLFYAVALTLALIGAGDGLK